MSRDTVISVYVSESEKNHLKSEANDAGETLSSYVYKLMQAERQRQNLDQSATELSAEERIEALIAEGTDALEEIAEDIRDMNARAGTYSVANFELLKQNYPDARRREVLQTGARRLRYPLEEHTDLSSEESNSADSDAETDDKDDDGPTEVDDLL
ncbi:hypothetical protein [Halalkalicoccus jeotgali]|uniref:Uncharacterized protein n=1 Tax=Halalkalicoccus jeotgali (strain DSM 18796 / CECT 7217 / JCM 14584 / KCTC 4019 / B3) TaxID=795797 RepID=D8JC56_HALJB|nr:hypothetical protein [Halalkalicoccus jeotgali]ADJ16963.1 hypothetical protein HacjB3_18103 [Halalkalicoccus jeotgali B3]ADJ16994.1 hypothetical protein HacjB3_18258 [Halalkalicoccus jeotgali B3]ELY38601.1 hypothetical protein C497_06664 [Halalkalicoccus jeotgali B3]